MQSSGFFKTDLEILNLIKEENNLTSSIVSFDATLKIKQILKVDYLHCRAK